ncbi:MAG TPA: TadE/TadG family type IV pilus assembly protein [Candidatus Binataceae bacterium]|nr:TadE/TadG family type IV pilus assembly protein [Candidatus Binataceae bacterium]
MPEFQPRLAPRPRSALAAAARPRGQATTEFAIVAAVFLTLLLGMIEFSCAMYAYDFVSYASSQTARYAMVHGSTSLSPVQQSDLQTYVQGLATGLNSSRLSASATWTPNNQPGSIVQVTVTYDFQFIGGLFPSATFPFTDTAQMRIAR